MCIRDSDCTSHSNTLSLPTGQSLRFTIKERSKVKDLSSLFNPVSYTHLDVYKRQVQSSRRQSPIFLLALLMAVISAWDRVFLSVLRRL